MRISVHVLVWICLIILSAIALASLSNSSALYEAVVSEIASISESLGPDTANRLVDESNGLLAKTMQSETVKASTRGNLFIPRKLESEFAVILDNTKLMLYLFVLRFKLLGLWFPVVGLLAAACVVDGVVAKKAKSTALSVGRPILFNFMWHAAILIIGASIVLLFAPVSLPAYSWLFIGFVLCLILMSAISISQPASVQ